MMILISLGRSHIF